MQNEQSADTKDWLLLSSPHFEWRNDVSSTKILNKKVAYAYKNESEDFLVPCCNLLWNVLAVRFLRSMVPVLLSLGTDCSAKKMKWAGRISSIGQKLSLLCAKNLAEAPCISVQLASSPVAITLVDRFLPKSVSENPFPVFAMCREQCFVCFECWHRWHRFGSPCWMRHRRELRMLFSMVWALTSDHRRCMHRALAIQNVSARRKYRHPFLKMAITSDSGAWVYLWIWLTRVVTTALR